LTVLAVVDAVEDRRHHANSQLGVLAEILPPRDALAAGFQVDEIVLPCLRLSKHAGVGGGSFWIIQITLVDFTA
jgi:hypothetical protein